MIPKIPKFEVRKIDDKIHGLYVDDVLVGTSKADYDARFHMCFLEERFKETWNAGYEAAINMVANS